MSRVSSSPDAVKRFAVGLNVGPRPSARHSQPRHRNQILDEQMNINPLCRSYKFAIVFRQSPCHTLACNIGIQYVQNHKTAPHRSVAQPLLALRSFACEVPQ